MANAKESPRPLCTLLQALKSIERLRRRWEVGDKNVVIVISHCRKRRRTSGNVPQPFTLESVGAAGGGWSVPMALYASFLVFASVAAEVTLVCSM